MNEESEWHHAISATVNEGPADCISIDEVAPVLKQMKRQSSRLVMASSRSDTIHRGYCNSADTGLIFSDRRLYSSGDPMECGSSEELNCWNMLLKWWKGSSNTEFGIRLIEMICSFDS